MLEIILPSANKNWYIILYDLFSRLWYIATCGPFCKNATHIYLLPLIKLQKKIVRGITFSKYFAHTAELFVNLDILPFKLLVVHRIGILMFKNYLGYVPNVVHSLFTTNASIHDYNTVISTNYVLLMAHIVLCTIIFVS